VAEGGEAYLREAAERFPDDPRVQWTVLYKNLFPEQRRAWLDEANLWGWPSSANSWTGFRPTAVRNSSV